MVEPTLDWEQVAREAKEIADAHGWNDPPEDDATHSVNVLCELFEAWQLYRAGHEVDEPITCEGAGCQMREVCKQPCEQYKPSGIAVELADAVLRALSRTGEVATSMSYTLGEYYAHRAPTVTAPPEVFLHRIVNIASDLTAGTDEACACVAANIVVWCEGFGVPLEDAIRQKMEYNRKRPWRHGGKRV